MKLTIEVNGETYNVELDEEVVEALRAIAERNGYSVEEAIAQAVVNERTLEAEVDSGGKLLVEKDDKLRRLEYA
jgi:predicted transcriptional regulator